MDEINSSPIQECLRYLKKLKKNGNLAGSCEVLSQEASTNGLENEVLRALIDVLTDKEVKLKVNLKLDLMKCLIPKGQIDDENVRDLVVWFLSYTSSAKTQQLLLHWFVGCWEYQLISKNSIYIFYDCLFNVMMLHDSEQLRLAQLIYLMTKPEDVTRRQVARLFKAATAFEAPKKHFTALLSLFKSYKPEVVPEKVKAINIQSVWRPINADLQEKFEKAKDRVLLSQRTSENEFDTNWNKFFLPSGKKNQQPLMPTVQYFNMGSSIFRTVDEKSIFDVYTMSKLGKYHSAVQLPCNATSLLTNSIGYHILTFAAPQYQQRFIYNLYVSLRKAFIFENGRFTGEEMNSLLDMTMGFCNYVQQGIPVLTYFINEYFSCFPLEYQTKILDLMQWISPSISTSELQDYVLRNLHILYYTSSIDIKCKIIKTLKSLMFNIFVMNNSSFRERPFPFLGKTGSDTLVNHFMLIEIFSRDLITAGLNIHNSDSRLLSEALSFYEQINMLNVSINVSPPTVVYGSFVTKSCSLLSRLCALLYNTRRILKNNKEPSAKKSIHSLIIYANDLVSALWFDNCFKNRKNSNRSFLKTLSETAVKNTPSCDINHLFNVLNHIALLPYLYIIKEEGLEITTKNDAMSVAAHYYSDIYQLINALLGK